MWESGKTPNRSTSATGYGHDSPFKSTEEFRSRGGPSEYANETLTDSVGSSGGSLSVEIGSSRRRERTGSVTIPKDLNSETSDSGKGRRGRSNSLPLQYRDINQELGGEAERDDPDYLRKKGSEAERLQNHGGIVLPREVQMLRQRGQRLTEPFKVVQKWMNKRKFKEGTRKHYPEIQLNNPAVNISKRFPSNAYESTKYSYWNFPFKILIEQFQRATSIYFLGIVIITLIPQISPISPWTSVLGLAFILVAAALREAYEDLKRRNADFKVNSRHFLTVDMTGISDSPSMLNRIQRNPGMLVSIPTLSLFDSVDGVLRESDRSLLAEATIFRLRKVRSDRINVGDLIYVRQGEPIPADMIAIKTGLADGVCFIETMSLDGETNLKIRRAPEATATLDLDQIPLIDGSVECEVPHHELYSFKGSLRLTGIRAHGVPAGSGEVGTSDQAVAYIETSLDESNLMPASAILRNTPYVLGLVVYTGPETKQSLNRRKPPSKFSTLDKQLDAYVYVIFTFTFIASLVLGILGSWFHASNQDNPYLDLAESSTIWVFVRLFFSYIVLMSFMIPLSLVVSLEVVKVFQGRYMEWDRQMAVGKHKMKVKTTNLNDELGLVQYVFSDKTGTLTENIMEFRKCSVAGSVFSENNLEEAAQRASAFDDMDIFLKAMALCNAVVTDRLDGSDTIIYKSSSPDEEALCQGAAKFGYCLHSRSSRHMALNLRGKTELYEVLVSMEFTSDRRRMSVILRCPDGVIRMFTKGADSVVLDRLRSGDHSAVECAMDHLDAFSKEGLRTLAVGVKVLTEEEFDEWHQRYSKALNLIHHREEEVEKLCDKMERGLRLVGCSAVEDKLQEGVPESIDYMLKAGIKVWVITGDKQSTAINIGYSTKLLTDSMAVVTVNATTSKRCEKVLLRCVDLYVDGNGPLARAKEPVAMVIDGATLKFALRDHPNLFLRFGRVCHSVICNRVTPLQKAKVVELVRRQTKACCLAIGDGSNDIGMIQAANIGVGIFGREGSEAARSSDYALRQFSHLRRLVCVHGRYNILRNSFVVNYSFYKNAALFLCQIWFSFWCGFSSQTLYDEWIMLLFNIFFTSMPPVVIGVVESDVPDRMLYRYPQEFRRSQKNEIFNLKGLVLWLSFAVYHSLAVYFVAYFWWGDEVVDFDGRPLGLFAFGNSVLNLGMVVLFTKLIMEASTWNFWSVLSIILSLLLYFVAVSMETVMLSFAPTQYFVTVEMTFTPSYWLFLVVGASICLLPDLLLLYVRRVFFPANWMILQEMDRAERSHESWRNWLFSLLLVPHSVDSDPYIEDAETTSLLKVNQATTSSPKTSDHANSSTYGAI